MSNQFFARKVAAVLSTEFEDVTVQEGDPDPAVYVYDLETDTTLRITVTPQ